MKLNKTHPRTAEWILLVVIMTAACAILYISNMLFYRAVYPISYRAAVEEESLRNGLPPSLVYAVIRTESGFNPSAQSSVRARGLMQITQDTFEWAQYRVSERRALHFDDLYESEENIKYGTAILRLLMEEFGTERNALCAYHAGWGKAKEWLENPEYAPDGMNIENIPYGDTRRYVEKVTRTKRTYETLYGKK